MGNASWQERDDSSSGGDLRERPPAERRRRRGLDEDVDQRPWLGGAGEVHRRVAAGPSAEELGARAARALDEHLFDAPDALGVPLRRNVLPFGHPAAAEAAGFRPCLRCRPDRQPDVGWIAAPELVCRAMHSIADGALDDATEGELATRLGVSARHLLAIVRPKPDAQHVIFHSYDTYTTNVPLADFDADDVLLAIRWNGAPISREHGGPVRMVLPRLYFWKSAKWIKRIEFSQHDKPGFWELRGYHNYGDPWLEQRYDTE